MSGLDPTITASYAFCRRTCRDAGSNFYPSFALLGPPRRRAMEALYAFMRHTDNLSDSREPLKVRRQVLARWRASLEAALMGEFGLAAGGASPSDPTERSHVRPSETLLPALVHTVERFKIPPEHLFAVIDGVEMDLDQSSYETFDDLAAYCERVASAVGMACIHVWGFRGKGAFEPARKCGIALQMTNILRDLKEDLALGRVYLPVEDLRRCGYSAGDLAAGVVDERFLRLMTFQIGRTRQLYHEGAELFDWLAPEGRRIFGVMTSVYYRLLQKIERRPTEVFSRRVRLSRWDKLGIAARWLLLPARRSALP